MPRTLCRLLRWACLALALQAPWAVTAQAATLKVPSEYATIQAAIDAVLTGAAPDGSTIEVQPGFYPEALFINGSSKSMTVRGVAGSNATVVYAGFLQPTLRLYLASGAVRFEGFTFKGGYGAAGTGGGFTFRESSPELVDVVFDGNSSVRGGGGAMFHSNPTFRQCIIRSNAAQEAGGGVEIAEGSRPTFTNCRFNNNGASTGGGAIDVLDASPTFRGCVIFLNNAFTKGGGIAQAGLYDSRYGPSLMLLEDTQLQANKVFRENPGAPPAEGGGIFVEGNATAYLVRATVLANDAPTGAGLSAHGGRFEISGSRIESNSAFDAAGVGGFGGGINLTSDNAAMPLRPAASLLLVDSAVTANFALHGGGGIRAVGDLLCGASSPGCVPATAARATVEIRDSLIAFNLGAPDGGGLRLDRVNLTLTGGHVQGNHAATPASGPTGQSNGGGLRLATGSKATIFNVTFARNISDDVGGGLFVDEGATIDLRNSRIYANTASSGGGLYVGSSGAPSGTVHGNVIADNSLYQIREDACAPLVPTILAYADNNIAPQSGSSDLYFSTCGGVTNTVAALNALPGLRASGNTSSPPSFVSFMATPGLPPSINSNLTYFGGASSYYTQSLLTWAASRATGVTISTVGTYPYDAQTATVAPVSSTTYSLTSTGGPVAPVSATVRIAVPWGLPNDTPVSGDFDGDGRRDRAVYRSQTGTWYLLQSTAEFLEVPWGSPDLRDVPVPADYDGDGKTDIAVFRPGTGQWFIRRSTGGTAVAAWGNTSVGDIPVPRDYDGDGHADIAVFRTSTGEWFIANSTGGMTVIAWGAPALGDVPVPADYDGDGRADIAVYRTSTGVWYRALSGGGGLAGVSWGAAEAFGLGDTPVPADYDGDGKADIAVARAATGDWYVLKSTGGSSVQRAGFGDVRLPGDFDGTGAAQIALWRAATGSWLVLP